MASVAVRVEAPWGRLLRRVDSHALSAWLLTATMNAFLAGQERVIVPALVASLICFALNVGLLSYIYRMERQ